MRHIPVYGPERVSEHEDDARPVDLAARSLGGLHPHRAVARRGPAVRRRCSSGRLGHPLCHQEPRTPVAELRSHYYRWSVSTAERAVDAHEPVVGCRCRCGHRCDWEPSVKRSLGGSEWKRTRLGNLADIYPYPWRSEHLPSRDDSELVTEEERRRGSC